MRTRNKAAACAHDSNAKSITELEIPESSRLTYYGKKFYREFYTIGEIELFTAEKYLKLLDKYFDFETRVEKHGSQFSKTLARGKNLEISIFKFPISKKKFSRLVKISEYRSLTSFIKKIRAKQV